MKKKIGLLFICILLIAFVALPLPKAGLTLRLCFDTFESIEDTENPAKEENKGMKLYYTTQQNPVFCETQTYYQEYDATQKTVTFRIDADTADQILSLRIDYPDQETFLSLREIAIGSAGVTKKRIDASAFFSEMNLDEVYDITGMNTIEGEEVLYIRTGNEDPHMCLNVPYTGYLLGFRSQYRITRLVIGLLAVATYLLYQKSIFSYGSAKANAAYDNVIS